MNYVTFLNQILPMIRERLPEGTDAQIRRISKNNGVEYTAVCLCCTEKEGASPLVYMEPFYDAFLTGMEDGRIADTVAEILMRPMPASLRASGLLSAAYIRDHVVLRLVGKERNQALLSEVVYRDFLDLAVTYGIYVENADIGGGMTLVRRDMLEKWQITEEELYGYAFENSAELLGDKLTGMSELLNAEKTEEAERMYVLTNRYAFYGASAALYSDQIPMLAEQLGSDLLILPSSVHELILTPREAGSYGFLKDLVREVNHTELRQENVLSDSVYLYRRDWNRITMFTEPDTDMTAEP